MVVQIAHIIILQYSILQYTFDSVHSGAQYSGNLITKLWPFINTMKYLPAIVLGLFFCVMAHAQSYPSRLISLTVPLAPGSQPDNVARVLAEQLRVSLGQPVIVENRPGADGMLGTEAVAKSLPDGHPLFLAISGPLTIAPAQWSAVPISPKARYA